MNDDISNRTLAFMVLIGLLMIFIGLLFSMNEFRESAKRITGKQTNPAAGIARVNISEIIELTLIRNSIDFGEGYRNQSYSVDSECNLSSYDQVRPLCWISTTDYPGENFSHFQLENTGTVYANVTIKSINASTFFGGPIYGGEPGYFWNGIHVVSDDGCLGENLTTVFTGFNNSEQLLCSRFLNEDWQDTLNVSINLSIPAGPIGQKSASVVFTARKTD